MERNEVISEIRAFNRFHTQLVGALNDSILASPFSLQQARVLFELAHAAKEKPVLAVDLAQGLQLDRAYLSRILAGLEADGLLQRTPMESDLRAQAIGLTEAGQHSFAALNAASVQEIAALIAPLTDAECLALVAAMQRIRRILTARPPLQAQLRAPRAGDLGQVIAGQARLYAQEFGWNQEFEGLVSDITGQFVREFQPEAEACWVADLGGEIVGSVFVVRQDAETAKLRMLYVDRAARGQGLGQRLVDEAMQFARGRGYSRMTLWTNDVLSSARKIYQARGFELVSEEPHHSFGVDLVGQYWACAL